MRPHKGSISKEVLFFHCYNTTLDASLAPPKWFLTIHAFFLYSLSVTQIHTHKVWFVLTQYIKENNK